MNTSKPLPKNNLKNRKMKNNITVHIPITMLSSIWKGNFKKLPPNKIYELKIDYPLQNPVTYKINTGKSGIGLISLLQKIGKLYKKTYEIEDATGKYCIYGHDIDDLSLCGVSVDHKRKSIKLEVNS